MVKSAMNVHRVNQQGYKDWVIQRISAIIMALYVIFLAMFFAFHSDLAFSDWHGLFAHDAMKVATVLTLLCVLFHAWVGMWTIFTDYIKPFAIRAGLNALLIIMLAACFVWGVLILWSV
jgi:succinate dehydrogenase / fumarate reductase, membrane anchor subunit